MPNMYGVDSVTPLQHVLPYLRGQWGFYPSFAARYVGASYATTAPEVQVALSLGVRMPFVYNQRAGNFALSGIAEGTQDAKDAMFALRSLSPAHRPLIFRDIESGQSVDTDYMLGWSVALAAYSWPGGFYLSGSQPQVARTYAPIVPKIGRLHRLVWTAQWIGYHAPSAQPVWAPTIAQGIPADDVVMWQFAGDVPQLNKMVDCNLATYEAYRLMLGAPDAATIYRVTKSGDLKQKSNHTSHSAVDEDHNPVTLKPGDQVVPTGPSVHTDDIWTPVKLPNRVVHGYFLNSRFALSAT